MDSYNRGPQAPQTFFRGTRGGPPPSSPPPPGRVGWGGGVNQSCLTAPLSDDTCQVKRVNAIEGGIRVASEWHEGGMAWHGMEWHGMASFILDI